MGMREVLVLLLICLLLAAGSFGVLFWAIWKAVQAGTLGGLDGILLIITALVLGLIFSGVAFALLRSGPVRRLFQPLPQENPDGTKQSPPESGSKG